MVTFSQFLSLVCFSNTIYVHHCSLDKPVGQPAWSWLQDVRFLNSSVSLFDVTTGGVIHVYLSD